MTHHGRAAELGEERSRELLERVREDHDLGDVAKPVEKVGGTVERGQFADHIGDLSQRQVVRRE